MKNTKEKTPFGFFLEEKGNHDVISIRGKYSPLFTATWVVDKRIAVYFATKNNSTLVSARIDHYAEIANTTFSDYLKGDFDLKLFEEKFNAYNKKTEEKYHFLTSQKLDGLKIQKLQNLVEETYNIYTKMISDTLFVEFLEKEAIVSIAKKVYGDNISRSHMSEILDKISTISFDSFEKRHPYAKKIIIESSQDILSAAQKARYLYTDYFSTKDIQHIQEDLKKYRRINIEKPKKIHISRFINTLDERESKIFDYLLSITKLRDYRKDVIAKLQASLFILAEEIWKRIFPDDKTADFLYTIPQDYKKDIQWLHDNYIKIKERKAGFEVYVKGDTLLTKNTTPMNIDKIESYLIQKHVDTISGEIASKGVACGYVKIILNTDDHPSFQKGNILVTSMTRPEFVPLMKKAGAIVTNEGGITSHAAIVSREMNKPCIIGTKFATQVLNDGDLVEVDADNGVVKILERNKDKE